MFCLCSVHDSIIIIIIIIIIIVIRKIAYCKTEWPVGLWHTAALIIQCVSHDIVDNDRRSIIQCDGERRNFNGHVVPCSIRPTDQQHTVRPLTATSDIISAMRTNFIAKLWPLIVWSASSARQPRSEEFRERSRATTSWSPSSGGCQSRSAQSYSSASSRWSSSDTINTSTRRRREKGVRSR